MPHVQIRGDQGAADAAVMWLVFHVRRPEQAQSSTQGLGHMLLQGKSRVLVFPFLHFLVFLHQSMLLPLPCPLEVHDCHPAITPLPLSPYLRLHKNGSHSHFESLFCAFLLCHFYISVSLFLPTVIMLPKPTKNLSPWVAHTLVWWGNHPARPDFLIKIVLVNCILCFCFLVWWLTLLQVLTTVCGWLWLH